jgi:hypothetical protein
VGGFAIADGSVGERVAWGGGAGLVVALLALGTFNGVGGWLFSGEAADHALDRTWSLFVDATAFALVVGALAGAVSWLIAEAGEQQDANA